MVFPTVDNHVDKERLSDCEGARRGGPGPGKRGGYRYFHCVETPNPPAMNANPITMFQLPMAWIGQDALVT